MQSLSYVIRYGATIYGTSDLCMANTIQWIILIHFGAETSIGSPEHLDSLELVGPQLNSVNHYYN